MMTRQLAHLVRLVDDLLEVSRITHGKIELRKEQVELASVIASAVETVRPLIDEARQRLEVSLPATAALADGDPIRLSQIFGNLLNNATKYTDAGQEIRIEASTHDGDVLGLGAGHRGRNPCRAFAARVRHVFPGRPEPVHRSKAAWESDCRWCESWSSCTVVGSRRAAPDRAAAASWWCCCRSPTRGRRSADRAPDPRSFRSAGCRSLAAS
jgi:hypothetical protein